MTNFTKKNNMNIAIGSDHAGFALKTNLITTLEAQGHQVKDFGCFSEDSIPSYTCTPSLFTFMWHPFTIFPSLTKLPAT